MNLQEFKTALESDATKRNKVQEQTIKDMREGLLKFKHAVSEEMEQKDKWIAQLERRCMVTTFGTLCMFCGHKSTCAGRQGKHWQDGNGNS